MENAIDALKIAAGVLMFVLALTISISCFSQANESVTAIVKMNDNEFKIAFDNIQPSNNLTRIVGIETILPTMYNAYEKSESFVIYFKDSDGNPMPIYYKTNGSNEREKDALNEDITVDYIGTRLENYDDYVKHLDMILAGKDNYKIIDEDFVNKYSNQFIDTKYPNGFLDYIKDKKFEEKLGEYYESGGKTTNQVKQRIITYQEVRELP